GWLQVQGRSRAGRCLQQSYWRTHSGGYQSESGENRSDDTPGHGRSDNEAVRLPVVRAEHRTHAGAMGHDGRRTLARHLAGIRRRQQPGRPARRAYRAAAQQLARCVQADDFRRHRRLWEIPDRRHAARQFCRPRRLFVRLQPDDRSEREHGAGWRTQPQLGYIEYAAVPGRSMEPRYHRHETLRLCAARDGVEPLDREQCLRGIEQRRHRGLLSGGESHHRVSSGDKKTDGVCRRFFYACYWRIAGQAEASPLLSAVAEFFAAVRLLSKSTASTFGAAATVGATTAAVVSRRLCMASSMLIGRNRMRS